MEQAEAIVTLQLYKLTNTDVVELEEKMEKLAKLIEGLKAILSDEEVLKYVMKKELKLIKKEYATPRLTKIEENIQEIKLDIKEMIPKENVVVVVTNEGYLKRVSSKSYAASTEDTTLKPGDFVTGLYECTTLDTLMVFTNLGNYLFIPVYKIPDMKWKELGKHVNNIIMLQDGEKVLTSYIYNKNKTLVLASKEGMAKRTLMSDFEVQRCNKPMTALKLKANDELVSVNLATDNILFITANGYYLNYKSEELPIVGTKASGVKGISLKEDQLITTISYDDKTEYVTLFTDNKTAKRVKISDLETHSRAKKGSTILKKTKTVTYKVITAFGTSARDLVLTKVDSDINILKNSDIAIMDLASTGSNISKYKLDTAAKVTLKEKIEDNEMPKKEEKTEEPKVNKALSIADFIDDFKL
jgi:topoisomerase-4 subunit A